MDATSWTVGAAVAILAAIGTSFRSLRHEMRAQGKDLHARIDAIDTQVEDLRDQMGLLRERMAHLEGPLEGLREAITGKRVA